MLQSLKLFVSRSGLTSALGRIGAVSLAAAFIACGAMAPEARAAGPLEMNFYLSGPLYEGRLQSCEQVLGHISAQFADKEATFWNSNLQIIGYSHVRENAFRPWVSNAIPRRYCSAQATISDGHVRTVRYSIIEDGGFAGFSNGIEWCVVGLDRNWAYNPSCRAAGP